MSYPNHDRLFCLKDDTENYYLSGSSISCNTSFLSAPIITEIEKRGAFLYSLHTAHESIFIKIIFCIQIVGIVL